MSRFSRLMSLTCWPALLALLPLACSRPVDTAQAENQDLRSDSGLPFGDGQTLPVGTLVTVRLRNPIAAESLGFNGVFDAVVDEAVLVEGTPIVPRGASVEGRVESAQASELRRNRGYVRLTLESVNVGGRDWPVETSSLFVHGDAGQAPASEGTLPSQVIRLESGRRLTFRLTEPLSIANPGQNKPH